MTEQWIIMTLTGNRETNNPSHRQNLTLSVHLKPLMVPSTLENRTGKALTKPDIFTVCKSCVLGAQFGASLAHLNPHSVKHGAEVGALFTRKRYAS